MSKDIPQHKRMAMGQKLASGGSVLKTGIPDSPIEKSKRNNGIPGFKKGGSISEMKRGAGAEQGVARKGLPGTKTDD